MSVDIAGLGDRRLEVPDASKQEFEATPDAYWAIASKLIKKIAPRFRPGLAEQILKSDDAISNIVTAIMLADWNWNGKGTRCGYRKQCVIWAIGRYITRDVARAKHQMLSLNFTLNEDGAEFIDLIHNNCEKDPGESVSETEFSDNRRDIVDRLLGSGILTNSQERCIRMHYLDEMSLADVGRTLGISREAVRQSVDRGMGKLRRLANSEPQSAT